MGETCTPRTFVPMTKVSALPFSRLMIVLSGILLMLIILELLSGSSTVTLWQILALVGGSPDESTLNVLIDFRIPKVLTGLLCGAGLATGGLLTQSLFRNPLTGPDILGLTSGAGLAVALAVLAGLPVGGLGLTGVAIIGSGATFLLLTGFSRRIGNHGLLVAGIMISAFTSSIVSALQAWSGSAELQRFTVWGLGTISQTGFSETILMAIPVGLGIVLGLTASRGLNAMGLSDDYARSMGIRVGQVRWIVLIASALLAGSITAFCGPVSFIGIAAPHLVKRITGMNDHRLLIPMSAVSGAIMVLACDLLTSLPGDATRLPLNAITALAGAPVVLWAIFKSGRDD